MKKGLKLLLVSLSFIICSCGNSTQEGENIKLSKEMSDFITHLNGSYEGVTQGIALFAEKELVDDDITRLDLAEPKVVKLEKLNSQQACYTLEAKVGIATKVFVLCWEDSKIYSIEDLGFKE